MPNTYLYGVDLTGADLRGANLTNAEPGTCEYEDDYGECQRSARETSLLRRRRHHD